MEQSTTLDELVDQRGLSLTELAEVAGISRRVLWDLRNGAAKKPRTTTVAKLAKALQVPVKVLRASLPKR